VAEPFRHRVRVRFNECDPQGVLFYGNYLIYFDVLMTEFWRAALKGGYAGMVASGTDAVVAEAKIRYRASARFDDEVDLVAQVVRLGSTSSITGVRAERDGELLAEGELRHVFIDPATFEKKEIPDEVRAGIGRFAA
jgi:acyl-CoA thioester hydrolase